MKELLNNALQGWGNYNYNGKYMALLFLVLLYFFLRKGRGERFWSVLLTYTFLMILCCVFPVTAALLMCYQTRFYDYQWILNYVPITIVIALGATVFLEDRKKDAPKKRQTAGTVVLLVVLVILCGRMGQFIVNPQTEEVVFDAKTEAAQRESVREVLAAIAGNVENLADGTGENGVSVLADSGASDGQICLWAPQEVMASARVQQPGIYLIYGRDMWDVALGAYTYETYGEAESMLYQWMHCAEIAGEWDALTEEGKVIPGQACMETAVAAGVNRILLPAVMQEDAVHMIEKALGVTAQKLEGYYLFVL